MAWWLQAVAMILLLGSPSQAPAGVQSPAAILSDLQRDQWKGRPTVRDLGQLPPETDALTLTKDDGWLYDRRTYHDFDLEYEVHVGERGRHRLFFRTLLWPRMAYEWRLERTDGRWRSELQIRRREMPHRRVVIEEALLSQALSPGVWQGIRVRASGDTAVVVINGRAVVTLQGVDALGGKVGFAGEDVTVRRGRLTPSLSNTPEAFRRAHAFGEEGLELPTVVRDARPEMPKDVSAPRVSVWIEAVVDERGDVVATRYLRRLPRQLESFNESAMGAVRRWKFTPARLDGTAVPVSVTIELSFASH